MSEARVNNLSNESSTGGPTISGITTFSGTNFFVPPVGSTLDRPQNPQKGAIRFNTDTKHLEYYKGDTIGWSEIEASSEELGGGTGSNVGSGARGVFMGGGTYPAGLHDDISYITISTLGNDTDFGDLTTATVNGGGCASRTRCIMGGGAVPTGVNTIEYVIFATTGDATNFGDLTGVKEQTAGLSNATRGIFAGGYDYPAGKEEEIDYITMASTGNAKDFGDLTTERWGASAIASSTRGVIAGGKTASPSATNVMDYITIATTGNAADFGDLSALSGNVNGSGASNSTRGVFMGGYNGIGSPNKVNTILYLTIATTGNTNDFGDMGSACALGQSVSSPTRAVTQLGDVAGNIVNTMEYIEIMTTGNASDFGELNTTRYSQGGSNAHGGL